MLVKFFIHNMHNIHNIHNILVMGLDFLGKIFNKKFTINIYNMPNIEKNYCHCIQQIKKKDS